MSETYCKRCEQAQVTNNGDIWIHRKTGKKLIVIGRIGYFGVAVRHEASGRKTVKLSHYLANDYELQSTAQSEEAGG